MTSTDAEPPPAAASSEADPRTRASRHLCAALAVADPDEKQYHIRAALQFLAIESE